MTICVADLVLAVSPKTVMMMTVTMTGDDDG